MKPILTSKNRGRIILYILFAIAVLSLVALTFVSSSLPAGIFPLALLLILLMMVFTGGLIIQSRGGPPW